MHRTDSYATGRRKSNHLGVVVKNFKFYLVNDCAESGILRELTNENIDTSSR